MWDFYLDMALSVLFRVLKTVLKDTELKANMKKALLKLRDAINFAYGEDEDFMAAAFKQFTPGIIEKYGGAAVRVDADPNPAEKIDAGIRAEDLAGAYVEEKPHPKQVG